MHRSAYAVVIGASMGGLIAARALSDAFEQVTILEQDELPLAPETAAGYPRAATPSNHVGTCGRVS